MLLGVLLGVAAGAFWGLIYIAPLLVPQYNPVLVALGRFISFGLVSLPFLFLFREQLKQFSKADIWESFRLPFFGNVIFYSCLTICIRMAGAPLAGMFMAIIPVLVAIACNFRYKKAGKALPWSVMLPPLVIIFGGLVVANWTEFLYMTQHLGDDPMNFWIGVVFGIIAVILWTWFSVENAEWLLAHRRHDTRVWTALQGVTVLPAVLLAFAVLAWPLGFMDTTEGLMGPAPLAYCGVALMLGLVCSWIAMLCWNGMSKLLPSALGGQMIVFESIFAVIYAHIYRGEWPTLTLVIGYLILMVGVMGSLYIFRNYAAEPAGKAATHSKKAGHIRGMGDKYNKEHDAAHDEHMSKQSQG